MPLGLCSICYCTVQLQVCKGISAPFLYAPFVHWGMGTYRNVTPALQGHHLPKIKLETLTLKYPLCFVLSSNFLSKLKTLQFFQLKSHPTGQNSFSRKIELEPKITLWWRGTTLLRLIQLKEKCPFYLISICLTLTP